MNFPLLMAQNIAGCSELTSNAALGTPQEAPGAALWLLECGLFRSLLSQHLLCMFLWCIIKETPIDHLPLGSHGTEISVHATVTFYEGHTSGDWGWIMRNDSRVMLRSSWVGVLIYRGSEAFFFRFTLKEKWTFSR